MSCSQDLPINHLPLLWLIPLWAPPTLLKFGRRFLYYWNLVNNIYLCIIGIWLSTSIFVLLGFGQAHFCIVEIWLSIFIFNLLGFGQTHYWNCNSNWWDLTLCTYFLLFGLTRSEAIYKIIPQLRLRWWLSIELKKRLKLRKLLAYLRSWLKWGQDARPARHNRFSSLTVNISLWIWLPL